MTTRDKQAAAIDSEREAIVRAAIRKSGGVQTRLRADAIAAYRAGGARKALSAIRRNIKALTPIVVDAMVTGHLQGAVRAYTTAGERDKTLRLDRTLDAVTKFLRGRLDLSAAELIGIGAKYNEAAAFATGKAAGMLEDKVSKAISEVTERGGHTLDGVTAIRKAFDAAGIVPGSDAQIETIFRTQTAIAYGAGQQVANEDPAIQDILWGYEYVTVGDDRVRPNHAAMNGARLPKNDPAWRTYTPPCGYNCRCTLLEIFHGDAEAKRVPIRGTYEIDGVKVKSEPDEGWGWNPADLYRGVVTME